MKGRVFMQRKTNEPKKANIELSEAARKARNAYKREWARKNREAVKAANRRYWEKKAAEMKEG